MFGAWEELVNILCHWPMPLVLFFGTVTGYLGWHYSIRRNYRILDDWMKSLRRWEDDAAFWRNWVDLVLKEKEARNAADQNAKGSAE